MRLTRLERAWKRALMVCLRALLPAAPAGPPPDWGAGPHRVLYLRHDRIGDMILATGLIRAVARSHPTITLDVLASPANAPVLRHEPAVHQVVIFDRRRPWRIAAAVRTLRRARYDAVLDCMVLSPSLTTLLLMLASGARHRIGVGGRRNAFALTLPVPPRANARHHVEHTAALAAPFGVDVDAADWRPVIVLTDAERATAEAVWRPDACGALPARTARLLVNISAGRPIRQWPDEHFVAALQRLRAGVPGADIVVMAAPAERAHATAIARQGNGRAVDADTIRQALALVATADFVLTPDTSIAHAASAFATPAVVMHPRGHETLYGPYRTAGCAVVSPTGTLDALPVAPVLQALDATLEQVPAVATGRLAAGQSTADLPPVSPAAPAAAADFRPDAPPP